MFLFTKIKLALLSTSSLFVHLRVTSKLKYTMKKYVQKNIYLTLQ